MILANSIRMDAAQSRLKNAKPHPSGLCPITRTSKILGSRWTAQIIREMLLHETRRFQDFHDALGTVAPNTLSARLKMLEENGLVEREFYENNPPRAAYRLTERGRAMSDIIWAMYDWGEAFT